MPNHNARHTALSKAAVNACKAYRCLAVPVQSGAAWVRSKRGWRPITLAAGGTVDLIAALPGGRTLWIECKTGEGRLTQTQRQFRDDLISLGHEHLELRDTVDDLLDILEGLR